MSSAPGGQSRGGCRRSRDSRSRLPAPGRTSAGVYRPARGMNARPRRARAVRRPTSAAAASWPSTVHFLMCVRLHRKESRPRPVLLAPSCFSSSRCIPSVHSPVRAGRLVRCYSRPPRTRSKAPATKPGSGARLCSLRRFLGQRSKKRIASIPTIPSPPPLSHESPPEMVSLSISCPLDFA